MPLPRHQTSGIEVSNPVLERVFHSLPRYGGFASREDWSRYLYEEIIGIGLSLRESQSGPCAYLLVRWGYFSHRPWWNTLRNTGTRAVILSSLALFAPEHRTSPRGIFDTPIDLDGDAAKCGRLQVWILLACLPECACFPSRYGLYAGSIRCSTCCGFRPAQAICCASESLCMGLTPFFRLHDQAQVPHPVRFFSVPFR